MLIDKNNNTDLWLDRARDSQESSRQCSATCACIRETNYSCRMDWLTEVRLFYYYYYFLYFLTVVNGIFFTYLPLYLSCFAPLGIEHWCKSRTRSVMTSSPRKGKKSQVFFLLHVSNTLFASEWFHWYLIIDWTSGQYHFIKRAIMFLCTEGAFTHYW